MRSAAILMAMASTFWLVSCSPTPPAEPETMLIGMGKSKLLACAGAPVTDVRSAGREYLTYSTEKTVGRGYLQSVPQIPGIGSLGVGGKGKPLVCEATVVIDNDTVAAVGLRADPIQDSRTTAELCKPILQACLSR